MVNVSMRGLRRARRWSPGASRRVTRLRGVPRRLAVVAERRAAAWGQTRQLGTRRAACCYYCETGVEKRGY